MLVESLIDIFSWYIKQEHFDHIYLGLISVGNKLRSF